MKLLDKFRVKKWLEVLLAPSDTTDLEQRQAMARLTQIGRPAIPYLLPALGQVPSPTTLVEFHLEDTEGGTALTIVESGFDRIPVARRAEAFRMNDNGWTGQIKQLAKYVE